MKLILPRDCRLSCHCCQNKDKISISKLKLKYPTKIFATGNAVGITITIKLPLCGNCRKKSGIIQHHSSYVFFFGVITMIALGVLCTSLLHGIPQTQPAAWIALFICICSGFALNRIGRYSERLKVTDVDLMSLPQINPFIDSGWIFDTDEIPSADNYSANPPDFDALKTLVSDICATYGYRPTHHGSEISLNNISTDQFASKFSKFKIIDD